MTSWDRLAWMAAVGAVIMERGVTDDSANGCGECSADMEDPAMCAFCAMYWDLDGAEFFREWFMELTRGEVV